MPDISDPLGPQLRRLAAIAAAALEVRGEQPATSYHLERRGDFIYIEHLDGTIIAAVNVDALVADAAHDCDA